MFMREQRIREEKGHEYQKKKSLKLSFKLEKKLNWKIKTNIINKVEFLISGLKPLVYVQVEIRKKKWVEL